MLRTAVMAGWMGALACVPGCEASWGGPTGAEVADEVANKDTDPTATSSTSLVGLTLAVDPAWMVPHDEDLVAPWQDAVALFDGAVNEALPGGRGVVALGEYHHKAATHSLLRKVVRASEVVDCLLLEYPATEQHLLDAYQAFQPCEVSLGIAEAESMGLDAPFCGGSPRRRLLRVARRAGVAVFAVDACRSCSPVVDAVQMLESGPLSIYDDEVVDGILWHRNRFMGDVIADLFAEGRCELAVLQTGRAYIRPDRSQAPQGPTVQDVLRGHGVPAVAWPVVDVAGEVHRFRLGRPEEMRWVRRDGETQALFLE